jgi:hypothetical protein
LKPSVLQTSSPAGVRGGCLHDFPSGSYKSVLTTTKEPELKSVMSVYGMDFWSVE